jgi:hypothetical protein
MRRARTAMARFWVCCIIVSALSFSIFAQQKLDQLLVYGDNFLFSVKEPSGWKGDTASAEKFQSNVVRPSVFLWSCVYRTQNTFKCDVRIAGKEIMSDLFADRERSKKRSTNDSLKDRLASQVLELSR